MSKSVRPNLSVTLPMKGEATRPEPLPADSAELPPSRLTDAPAPELRVRPARIVRVPITVKISEQMNRRLREAAFREERDKQDIVEEALDALLQRLGY